LGVTIFLAGFVVGHLVTSGSLGLGLKLIKSTIEMYSWNIIETGSWKRHQIRENNPAKPWPID